MIETSESIAKLMSAILHVQGAISGVKKDAKNPHFRNSYATLEQVIDTARPALQEAKIAFIQAPGKVIDGALEVTTMLVHEAEWLRSTLHVPLQKLDAQGVGSAITYACRYSLMALLGLPPTDDDDGTAAIRTDPPRKENGKPEQGWREDGTRTSFALKKEQPELMAELDRELDECQTLIRLERLKDAYREKAGVEKWNKSFMNTMKEMFDRREQAIMAETDRLAAMEPEELSQLDPRTAFEHSAAMNNLRAG